MSQIRNLGLNTMRPEKAMKSEIGQLVNRVDWGNMYLFMYDPKLKNVLPYYDQFPLVLPFRLIPDGFLGLNLHYLRPLLRMKLLGNLMQLATNNKYNRNTRIQMSWSILNNAARFPEVFPCVKRYKYTHVKTRFLKVNPKDWNAAILLPIETFRGDSKTNVHHYSQEMINNV